MPTLSLRHMQMLKVLEERETLALAAEALLITQSALTHRIREAERRLGITLFEKKGRNLRPTAASQILTDIAKRVLRELDEAERVAIASSEGISHIVRLTVGTYNAYHWLPGFLAWFRQLHPEVMIELEPNASPVAIQRLIKDELDVAVIPGAAVHTSVDSIHLFDDELVAVVWPGHEFEGRDYLIAQDFKDQTYLTYSLASEPGFEAERLWEAEKASPLRKRNLGSIEAICELVKAKTGITVLSRWALEREFASNSLVALQVTQMGIKISWRASVSGRAPKDAPGRVVAAALQEWFSQI